MTKDGDTISISLSEKVEYEIEERKKFQIKKIAQMDEEIISEEVGCSNFPSTSTDSFK